VWGSWGGDVPLSTDRRSGGALKPPVGSASGDLERFQAYKAAPGVDFADYGRPM